MHAGGNAFKFSVLVLKNVFLCAQNFVHSHIFAQLNLCRRELNLAKRRVNPAGKAKR